DSQAQGRQPLEPRDLLRGRGKCLHARVRAEVVSSSADDRGEVGPLVHVHAADRIRRHRSPREIVQSPATGRCLSPLSFTKEKAGNDVVPSAQRYMSEGTGSGGTTDLACCFSFVRCSSSSFACSCNGPRSIVISGRSVSSTFTRPTAAVASGKARRASARRAIPSTSRH